VSEHQHEQEEQGS